MQLAATQRPHPPPVPPRPSRQVVAEALKRSPRPPCPTRQAPPPPNTKPWRSDREQVCPAPGRTVVYESIKESVPPPKEIGLLEPAPLRAGASERRAADEHDRRGNPRERRHRAAADQEHRANSSESSDAVSFTASLHHLHHRHQQQRSTSHQGDSTAVLEHALSSLADDLRIDANQRLDDDIDEPSPTTESSVNAAVDRIAREDAAESVSSVDRATVVVVDETDRKGGSNEQDDHRDRDKDNDNDNDNDNENIHRQDWLEAGVRYSSTQIRLSGEDDNILEEDRVINGGLDRCENEKVGDPNVPR
ncbi:PREDICTED: cleavage and polyadenylation specificity factor subunit 6-like [Habropoda laboriosa]|uniref:cleavage and polyadenylation specificity factor subunit 6-like n=1 Tax=Habropoda laboriosa TaxID=597456 RepID=UPI00083E2A7F|nr:PREDICTED: cleavage and polyadenylation specificity factor subunit 6-like [Habropoda laboriosa]